MSTKGFNGAPERRTQIQRRSVVEAERRGAERETLYPAAVEYWEVQHPFSRLWTGTNVVP